jgi:2-polyprenyl-3-methyl-5-hydroxy-6-metoxy-1,4-benzoquinol methylase
MENKKDLKNIVKVKYAQIAVDSETESCCSPGGCGCSGSTAEYTVFKDDYTGQKGYVEEADLGLGCGLPTEFAGIKEGYTVLDLGSGAGNDVFVARALAGDKGKVIGLDMTEEMIAKAEKNKARLGYDNV